MSITTRNLLVVTFVSCLSGCHEKISFTQVTISPRVLVCGLPVSEAEAREFGLQFAQAMKAGDQQSLKQLLNLKFIADTAVRGLPMPADMRRGFQTGVRSREDQLIKLLAEVCPNGGSFDLLGVRQIEGRLRVVCRLLNPDGGLNYQHLLLTRSQEGKILIEDMYIVLTGELISQSLRRNVLQLLSDWDNRLLAKLGLAEQHFMKNLPELGRLNNAVEAQDYQEAMNIYRRLPRQLQKEKNVLLLAILAASQPGEEEECKRLVGIFRAEFPTDPAVALMSIDYHLLRQEYDQALNCIDDVDRQVGGDPYLGVLRGGILIEAGRWQESRDVLEKTIELDPDLFDAYDSRLALALREKNHQETAAWLKKLVERFETEMSREELEANDLYQEFLTSPEAKEYFDWYHRRQLQGEIRPKF